MTTDEPAGLGINGVIPGDGACVYDGCLLPIPEGDLMCSPHWRSVPNGLKANLRFVLRRWYGGDANLGEVRASRHSPVDGGRGHPR
jgi:hypothetical protein